MLESMNDLFQFGFSIRFCAVLFIFSSGTFRCRIPMNVMTHDMDSVLSFLGFTQETDVEVDEGSARTVGVELGFSRRAACD